MTDNKIEKIRAEIKRLKSQLLRGACSSQVAMETRCKEEAYNEVLAILDTLQEEPVSEEWIEELRTKLASLSKEDFKKVFDKYDINFDEEPVSRTPADIEAAMQEVEEKSRVFTEAHHGEDADTILAQMRGEEHVSDDLNTEMDNYLASVFNEDMDGGEPRFTTWFRALRKTAIHFANWQKEQFEKNRLKHCKSITNEQAELEQGFIDQHLDKHQRMPTFLDAIEYGMRLQREKMINGAVNGLVYA